MTVSPNNELLAYAADTVGGEKYSIFVKELATGRQLLRSPIPVRPLHDLVSMRLLLSCRILARIFASEACAHLEHVSSVEAGSSPGRDLPI